MKRFLGKLTGWARRAGRRPVPAGIRQAQLGVEELECRELYSVSALAGASSPPPVNAPATAQAPGVSRHAAANAAPRHGTAVAAGVSARDSLDGEGADDGPVSEEGAAPADAPEQAEAPSTDEGPALPGESAGADVPTSDLVWAEPAVATRPDQPSRWDAAGWLWEADEVGDPLEDAEGLAPSGERTARSEGSPASEADSAVEDEEGETTPEPSRWDAASPSSEPGEAGATLAEVEGPAWTGGGAEEASADPEEALDELDEALEALEEAVEEAPEEVAMAALSATLTGLLALLGTEPAGLPPLPEGEGAA